MYRHALIPIDCSEEARQAAVRMVGHLGSVPACRVTLVAAVTASPLEEIREKKRDHAYEALRSIGKILHGYGIYATQRVAEAAEGGDAASGIIAEANRPDERYDVILLGTHQTRPDDEEEPCAGSLADKLCRRVNIPVLVLPTHMRGTR
jgi:nucleotide-binding universal stress UspA family protein